MESDEKIPIAKLVGRQRRPATGDVFRVHVLGGNYYFGLVVDGNMKVGPFAPGSILVVIFSGSSSSGEMANLDELSKRPFLMPPAIVNQRPWTLGYAEKIGTINSLPKANYLFRDSAFGKFVDRYGHEVEAVDNELVGVWGVGNEWTLADKLITALSSPEE